MISAILILYLGIPINLLIDNLKLLVRTGFKKITFNVLYCVIDRRVKQTNFYVAVIRSRNFC